MGAGALAARLVANRAATWLLCGLAGFAVHLVLWRFSEPPDLFSDFYKAYYPAAELLWEEGLSAKWPLTEAAAGGFVNIPIMAWLFVPLIPLGEDPAGWAHLAFGAVATAAAWALISRMGRPENRIAAPLLFLFLVNGPLVNSLREGNTTHIVLLLLVAILLLLRAGWTFTAGLLLGLCALIKLPLLLYGLYFLLRQRWRVVAGGAAAIALAVLLSLAVYGLQGNIAWYKDSVEPFLGGIIPAFNVQSIDGFLMRLVTGTERLNDWDPITPGGTFRVVRLGIFAAIAAWAIWLMRRPGGSDAAPAGAKAASTRDELEFVLVLNLALVTSPISWTHYYLLLLLPWGLYFGGRLPLPEDWATRWLMRSSLVLVSLPVITLPLPPGWLAELVARTLVSAWFFGGLLMLAALARGIRQSNRQTNRLQTLPA